jgi:hypothetical protein
VLQFVAVSDCKKIKTSAAVPTLLDKFLCIYLYFIVLFINLILTSNVLFQVLLFRICIAFLNRLAGVPFSCISGSKSQRQVSVQMSWNRRIQAEIDAN